MHLDSAGVSNYGMVGVANISMPLSISVGGDVNGWSYYQQTGKKYYNNAATAYGSAWATNTIIGCAVDLDTGNIWWSYNGAWIASGDPATGANPAFTGLTGTLYPATSIYASNGDTVTARFSAVDQTYAAPSGFTAWG
ncbi:MAG: hypothetical protein B7Z80_06345 [Rhodospirillales bacterium 20-64-7]|nr:MAG: hypothetical protein B7Z80_06345 [Rhodospirillales bacterium 20-64-7]